MAATLPPTPDEVRARSELLTGKFPPPPSGSDPDPLQPLVDDAIAMVQGWTGRILDPDHPENAASAYAEAMEATPPGLIPIAVRAVTLTAEQMSVTGELKLARQRAGRLRLRGFTAGPYSEQYWDPAMVRGATARRPQFVDDPDLDDALWQLATEEARQTLTAETTGVQLPAAIASPTNFNRQPGVGGSGWFGGGGPDGW